MRILLADDQKEIRLLAVNQLERDGHSVVAVSDGSEALAEFDRTSFDVLLLDEHMPTMSGVEVLHAVRGTEKGRRQLTVAVTGYNTEEDRRRLLREGFDAVSRILLNQDIVDGKSGAGEEVEARLPDLHLATQRAFESLPDASAEVVRIDERRDDAGDLIR